MKLGNYKITEIINGYLSFDVGNLFNVIPKNFWDNIAVLNDRNRIVISLRSLLIENCDKKILIDTGIGNKLGDIKEKDFNLDNNYYSLDKSLNINNIETDDITDVILTHLHMDHSGGSTYKDEDGTIKPTFKNAMYYIQKSQYEYALNPPSREKSNFKDENYKPLEENSQLKLLEGECELFEDIYIKVSYGHTNGMQIPIIKGKDRAIVCISDLAPSSYNLSINLNPFCDLDASRIVEEKKSSLRRKLLKIIG